MSSIKLLLAYHKPDVLLKDDILTPIHAGRALARERLPEDSEDLQWLLENTIGDDAGDNISEKNASYNEMTALYWAWKHYEELGDPEYVGFMHYRRHFMFKDGDRTEYELTNLGAPEYLSETLGYSREVLEEILADCDFVYPRPHFRKTVRDHFERNHHIQDLDTAVAIIGERFPDFAASAETYLAGNKAIFCNMFIMPKAMYFEYADFMFTTLEELEARADMEGKRMFVSEWLTGIFITEMLARGLRGRALPRTTAEGPHTIPVVMAADLNYSKPLAVTITSLLENAQPNTSYEVNVLVAEEYPEDVRDKLLSFETTYPGTKINFVVVDSFKDITITTSHVTVETYFRLMIPTLFPELKRCIYLDVDLVVERDLTPLFRQVLDDKYLAGVYAASYRVETDEKAAQIGLPSYDRYVNAGVLLMNLEKIRQDGLVERFIELSTKGFESDDQDVLNVACYDGILSLPFRFNVMTKYLPQNFNEFWGWTGVKESYSMDEWEQAMNSPVIIHYADKRKPWKDASTDFADRWWHYAALSPVRDEISAAYLADAMSTSTERIVTYRGDLVEARRARRRAEDQSRKAGETAEYQDAVLASVRLEREVRQLKRALRDRDRELADTRGSVSFKVGRAATMPLRKVRDGKRRAGEEAPAAEPSARGNPAAGGPGAGPAGKDLVLRPAKPAPPEPADQSGGIKRLYARAMPASKHQAASTADEQRRLIRRGYRDVEAKQVELGRSMAHLENMLEEVVGLVRASERMTVGTIEDASMRTLDAIVQSSESLAKMVGEASDEMEKLALVSKQVEELAERTEDVYGKALGAARSSSEAAWAARFHDGVSASPWLAGTALTPGRRPAGYPFLIALHRTLEEMRPAAVLELGLGQATTMTAQYAANHPDVRHQVIEHDQGWIRTFGEGSELPSSTITALDLENASFRGDSVIRYRDFDQATEETTSDLVVVAGPVEDEDNVYTRIDVLDLIPQRLSDRFVIILDDYDRPAVHRTADAIMTALRDAEIDAVAATCSGTKTVWLAMSPELRDLGLI